MGEFEVLARCAQNVETEYNQQGHSITVTVPKEREAEIIKQSSSFTGKSTEEN